MSIVRKHLTRFPASQKTALFDAEQKQSAFDKRTQMKKAAGLRNFRRKKKHY